MHIFLDSFDVKLIVNKQGARVSPGEYSFYIDCICLIRFYAYFFGFI